MRLVGSVVYPDSMEEVQQIAEYVRQRIPRVENPFDNAIGALGVDRGGDFLGGIVFYNPGTFKGQVYDVEMAFAFDRADWIRPATLRHLFCYPFRQLNCVRMSCIIARKNKKTRKLAEFCGFKVEGVGRKRWDGVQDCIYYGMTREDCRFLEDNS